MKINLTILAVILQVVFLTLKLTGVIAWSWWVVFIPLLALAGIWIIIGFILLLFLILAIKYGDL